MTGVFGIDIFEKNNMIKFSFFKNRMTEVQSANPEQFPLLSEGVEKVIEEGAALRLPVLTSWILRNIPRPRLVVTDEKKIFFEEEELLEVMPRILDDADHVFFAWPESVNQLKTSHDGIKGREDDYLRFALAEQRKKYEQLLKTLPSGNLEKQLRNISRRIEETEKSLQALLDKLTPENIEKRIYEERDRQSKQETRKKQSYRKPRTLLTEIQEVVDKIFWQQSVKKIGEQMLKKWRTEAETLMKKLERLQDQQSTLEQEIEKQKTIQDILGQTRTRLQALKIPDTAETKPKNPKLTQPRYPDTGSNGSGRKRKHRNESPENGVSKNGTNGASEKDAMTPLGKPDSVALDVKKITEAIAGQEKIRILVGPNHNRRFEKNWKKVLEQLGFSGTIEIVFYENLARTSDYKSVVLVPKGMNTHHNKGWRKNLEHIVIIHIHETLILNYLNAPNPPQAPVLHV